MIVSSIITIVACCAWWRMIQTSLQFYRLRVSTIFVMLWLSIVGVLTIVVFPHLYHYFHHYDWWYPLSLSSVIQYIWYIWLVWLIVSLVVFYRAWSEILYHQGAVMILVWCIMVLLSYRWSSMWYYYLLLACVEEYIKFYLWNGSSKIYGIVYSDMILFGMLSGLWFACIENIVYLFSLYHSQWDVVQNIVRWIIWPIVHIVYSGGIMSGYRYLQRSRLWIWGLLISMTLIMCLHTLYNFYVPHMSWLMIMCIVFLWYMMISWMIYQCDRLYLE